MQDNIPVEYQNDPSAPFNEESAEEHESKLSAGDEPDDFTGADGSEER